MDHQFIQFIDDLTKDGWNLSPQPKALEIQKDSDFIDNIKYMSVRTKVHLLLQLAISSQEYMNNHKDMIITVVSACIQDQDRWVSEIARLLLSNYSNQSLDKEFLESNEQERLNTIAKNIQDNTLYSKPLPFSLKPTHNPFGKWKKSLVQPPISKDNIKLRQSMIPHVKGSVGVLRKRSHPTPTPSSSTPPSSSTSSHSQDKKIRITSSTVKPKPKVKVVSSEPKPVEKPSQTTEVTLPSPIPVASNKPFVPLSFDTATAKKLRLNYKMMKEAMEPAPTIPANEDLYCYAGLFINILRKLGYEGIQNEVCDSVSAFMKGNIPHMTWNNEEEAVDYLVSINEKEHKITIIRLFFKDFSWELIEELY